MKVLSLGEKIRKRRKELNLTLKEVALTKITPGQISLVESGKSNPSIDLLNYLSEKLDVSLDYLMETEYSQVNKIGEYYATIIKTSITLGKYELCEEYISKYEKLIEKYPYKKHNITILYLKGLFYYHTSRLEMAIDILLKASIEDNLFNYNECYGIHNLLGKICLKEKNYTTALNCFLNIELLLDKSYFNVKDCSETYFLIAKSYEGLKNEKLMLKYIKKSLDAYSEINGGINTTIKYLDETINYEKENKDFMALSLGRELSKQTREFEKMRKVDNMLYDLAKLARENDFNTEALKIFANLVTNEFKYKEFETFKINETVCDLLDVLIERKDFKLSEKILSLILDGAIKKDSKTLIRLYEIKAKLEIASGNDLTAQNNLILALNIAENKNLHKEHGEIALKMSNFYLNKGEEEEAIKYLEMFMKDSESNIY